MNMNVMRNFSLHNAEEILLKHKQYGFQYLHSPRTNYLYSNYSVRIFDEGVNNLFCAL